MKKIKILLMVMVTAGILLSHSKFAVGDTIELSSTLDVYSKYVWRGFTLDTDPVVQPGFSIGAYGLSLSFWGSFDAEGTDDLFSDEMDYTLDYSISFDKITLSVGNTFYTFPELDLESLEFYAGISFDVPFSPGVTIYVDYGDEEDGGGDGIYFSLDGSQSFELADGVSFDVSAHYGYNDELFISGDGSDVSVVFGFSILKDSFTFNPVISYSYPLGDLEDEMDGNQEDQFFGGFSLGFSI